MPPVPVTSAVDPPAEQLRGLAAAVVAVARALPAVLPVLHVLVRRAGGRGAAAHLGQVALRVGGRAAHGVPLLELEGRRRRRSSAASQSPLSPLSPSDSGLRVPLEPLRGHSHTSDRACGSSQ